MDNLIKLPIDLPQVPAFRGLAKALGGVPNALYVWFHIWQGLVYQLQDGGPAGRIGRFELPTILKSLTIEHGGALDIRDEIEFEKAIFEAFFKADGDDLVCLRFVSMHGGVSSAPRSMAQKGGDMRAYTLRQKESEVKAFQTTLNISEHKFVDAEGNPLDSETSKRVTRLIIACDNALFRPLRPTVCFTEGLIASALEIALKFSDEEIDYVCRTVASHRNHPVLSGLATEKLLPVFQEIVNRLDQK